VISKGQTKNDIINLCLFLFCNNKQWDHIKRLITLTEITLSGFHFTTNFTGGAPIYQKRSKPIRWIDQLLDLQTDLEPQLLVDDVQVTDGIDLAFNVSDLLVLKSSWKKTKMLQVYIFLLFDESTIFIMSSYGLATALGLTFHIP